MEDKPYIPQFKQEFISIPADITEYPDPIIPLPKGAKIDLAVGDLHGNALKLVYFLIKHGVLEISREDYARLVKSYQGIEKIKLDQVMNKKVPLYNHTKTFRQIIKKATVNNNERIIMIGDEVCDRGALDPLQLDEFELLHKNEIDFEILLSNHGIEFILALERIKKGETKRFFAKHLHPLQSCSMRRMQALIDSNILKMDDIMSQVEEVYLPKLKAITYSLDEDSNTIVFYTHAPISMFALCYLAIKLGAKFHWKNARDIADGIDQINEKIAEHVKNNTLSDILKLEEYNAAVKSGTDIETIMKDYPLEFFMWNRKYEGLIRLPQWEGINTVYVNGHDRKDPLDGNGYVFTLDSFFGMGSVRKGKKQDYRAMTFQPKRKRHVFTESQEGNRSQLADSIESLLKKSRTTLATAVEDKENQFEFSVFNKQ